MPHRRLTLVAYDISSARTRARALKAVKAFGLDGQKSAHECALSDAERSELQARLKSLIDPATDRLMIVVLDPRTIIRALRTAKPAAPPTVLYVG